MANASNCAGCDKGRWEGRCRKSDVPCVIRKKHSEVCNNQAREGGERHTVQRKTAMRGARRDGIRKTSNAVRDESVSKEAKGSQSGQR